MSGSHRIDGKTTWVVSREGPRLFFQRTGGGERREILPASEVEFFTKDSVTPFRFEMDDAGRVTTLTADNWGRTETATRH